MTDDTDESETYSGFLVLNWRDDDIRFRKTPPKGQLAPQELAIPLSIDVTIPEVQVPEIHADIEVPPAKVEEAVTSGAETFDDEDDDPDAVEDWMDD